ncbi:ABC transporter permease [Culicoidibacter larvae]|uniref:Transport permease protein n=1 Tax=Culicoidibacter larvae TaxID=2579976 RepID=A0A5R8Q9E7_9FIRM|nr:ABC transporter permease [Culicoidibacter larvae]TLG72530.1 ABC transporter permease [Culicoidibacter larvae]
MSKVSRYISDMRVMVGRSMHHTFRSMDTIITVIAMPVMMMLLFVYVFGGAINTGTTESYVNYMLPGILLMAIASGVSYAAVRLNSDVTKGIFERFFSMPIARSTVLWGHVITSVVSCFISVAVIIVIALIIGFRSSAGILEWMTAGGLLLLFTLAMTWLAVISGLLAKTAEGAAAFSYPLIFLPFISSAFVPTASMPYVLQVFADNQPMTIIVNAVRSLLANQPDMYMIWLALAWCAGLLVVIYGLAMWVYKRKLK